MLPPPHDDLVRRRQIWEAVSQLLLDEDLDEYTTRYIARVAARCGYTEAKLEEIYHCEVAPAVAHNAYGGLIWGGFDPVWLEERILHRGRLSYWIERLIFAPFPKWSLRDVWKQVQSYHAEERERGETS